MGIQLLAPSALGTVNGTVDCQWPVHYKAKLVFLIILAVLNKYQRIYISNFCNVINKCHIECSEECIILRGSEVWRLDLKDNKNKDDSINMSHVDGPQALLKSGSQHFSN